MTLSFQTFMAGACKGADSKMLNDVQWQWLEVIDITDSKMTRPFFFFKQFIGFGNKGILVSTIYLLPEEFRK